MRNNTPVEPKSFSVTWDNNEPRVKPSHWVPGYSPSHKATERAAILHEADRLEREIAELEAKHKLVEELYEQQRGPLPS